MKRNIRRAFLILWIVIIFILTGFPMLEVPELQEIPTDKLYHFIVFFVMGLLAARSLSVLGYIIVGLIVVLLAECQQLVIPGRNFELMDIAAGITALAVSFFIFRERAKEVDVSKA
ncbi:MAG: hypothetical protein JSU64_05370 [candidate division WOR-3 bacterium]|nr:MAG: hypothetical protein JSU64_05370 [candidate division WOR-3 bacterium]